MRNVTGSSSRYVGRAGQETRRTPTDAAAAVGTIFAGRNENSEQSRTIWAARPKWAPGSLEHSRYRFTTGSGRNQARFQDMFQPQFQQEFQGSQYGFRAVSVTHSVISLSPISEPISQRFSKLILLGLRSTATGKPAGGAAWEAQRGLRRPEHLPLSNSSS